MRVVGAILLLAVLVAQTGLGAVPSEASSLWEPPTGTIAGGHIEPVPLGQLYVGVVDNTLQPGASADLGGPPAFVVSDSSEFGLSGLADHSKLIAGGSLFLPGGAPYHITNMGSKPARFRFIGLGAKGEVKGALYEMEPLPWGPGEGRAYDVTLDRGPFGANSSTPWHIHTGPAFGVLDGGTWENRQLTGDIRRIPTPGYYVQPAGKSHQLAQVGTGGYALIVQFFPPHQPKTTGGPERGAATPTTLTEATVIPTANPANTPVRPLVETSTPLVHVATPTAVSTSAIVQPATTPTVATVPITVTSGQASNTALPALTSTPSPATVAPGETPSSNNAPIVIVAITAAAVLGALGSLAGVFVRRQRKG